MPRSPAIPRCVTPRDDPSSRHHGARPLARGSLSAVLGRTSLVDVFSSMCYPAMCGENVTWIAATTTAIARLTNKPCVPIIQVADISASEFAAALDAAFQNPSAGVIVFNLRHPVQGGTTGAGAQGLRVPHRFRPFSVFLPAFDVRPRQNHGIRTWGTPVSRGESLSSRCSIITPAGPFILPGDCPRAEERERRESPDTL